MRKDTEEALRRLEQELLAEEEPEAMEEEPEETEEELDFGEFLEEPDSEEPVVYQNYSNHYGADLRNYATGYKAYNSDRSDTDLETFSEEVHSGKKASCLWLPVLIAVVAAALVLYMLWRYLGGGI